MCKAKRKEKDPKSGLFYQKLFFYLAVNLNMLGFPFLILDGKPQSKDADGDNADKEGKQIDSD